MMYGWYSEEAKRQIGSLFYRKPSGEEVEVTFITEDIKRETYKWADKVCIGPVSSWSRGYIDFYKYTRKVSK